MIDTGRFRKEGIFERVVQTRFCHLAILEGSTDGYMLAHLTSSPPSAYGCRLRGKDGDSYGAAR